MPRWKASVTSQHKHAAHCVGTKRGIVIKSEKYGNKLKDGAQRTGLLLNKN